MKTKYGVFVPRSPPQARPCARHVLEGQRERHRAAPINRATNVPLGEPRPEAFGVADGLLQDIATLMRIGFERRRPVLQRANLGAKALQHQAPSKRAAWAA